jgi:hypothetical protein
MPPPFTEHDNGGTVFIGASNLGKIATVAENGHMVADLTSGGWTPKSGRIEKLCETLKKLNLTEFDTVIIDPMLNSAFLGTDKDVCPFPWKSPKRMGDTNCGVTSSLTPPLPLGLT